MGWNMPLFWVLLNKQETGRGWPGVGKGKEGTGAHRRGYWPGVGPTGHLWREVRAPMGTGTSSSTTTGKREKGALYPSRQRANDNKHIWSESARKGQPVLSARPGPGCLIGYHSSLWVLSPLPPPSLPPLKLCIAHDSAAGGYCQPDSSWRGRNKDPELQGPSLDEAYPWRCQALSHSPAAMSQTERELLGGHCTLRFSRRQGKHSQGG